LRIEGLNGIYPEYWREAVHKTFHGKKIFQAETVPHFFPVERWIPEFLLFLFTWKTEKGRAWLISAEIGYFSPPLILISGSS
jgi:hypothetical protein